MTCSRWPSCWAGCTVPLSRKQQEYLRRATRRWNIKTGATRSGKTYLDYSVVIPKRVLDCAGAGHIVLLGNTQGTVSRNVLEPMRAIWGERRVGPLRGNSTVSLFGRRAYVLGADKVNSVVKLQGAGIQYCYGDEVTTWHESVFQMLKSRLDKPNSVFDGTCNPAGPGHWFKAFLESGADLYTQAYTIDDNPFLPAKFVTDLKSEYAGTVFYDRFILGRWVAAEGVIYRLFADDPEAFVWDEEPLTQFCVIGGDFGGTKSAQAFCCTGFLPGLRGVVTLDEYYTKAAVDAGDLAENFVAFVRRQLAAGRQVVDIRLDSAEQVLIRTLARALARSGIRVPVHNAVKGPIVDRIRLYGLLMGAGRYHVMRRCGHTIDAFSQALWDAKKLEDVRLDDGTTNIDSLDAQEYSTEPYQRQLIDLMGR